MKAVTASLAVLAAALATGAVAAPPAPVGGVAKLPSAGSTSQVRVVSRAPLTLLLARRAAGERVRVSVLVHDRVFTRVVVARRDGTVVLRLVDVLVRRCQPVYVRIAPSRVRLEVIRWPSLDCAPTT